MVCEVGAGVAQGGVISVRYALSFSLPSTLCFTFFFPKDLYCKKRKGDLDLQPFSPSRIIFSFSLTFFKKFFTPTIVGIDRDLATIAK